MTRSADPTVAARMSAQIQRSRRAIEQAVRLRAEASAMVAAAVTTVSWTATRHGRALRTRRALPATVPDLSTGQQPLSWVFTAAGIGEARSLVVHVARCCGLDGDELSDFVLAAQELMTNAVRHGGGWGRIRLYCVGGVLVCVIADRGPGLPGDPATAGMSAPAKPATEGGRGLWLARQMTGTMHIDSGPSGVTVAITARTPDPAG